MFIRSIASYADIVSENAKGGLDIGESVGTGGSFIGCRLNFP
jgi:hypothetical protein